MVSARPVYPGSSASLERITRQGLGEDVLQRLAARRPEEVDAPATIRWGKSPKFTVRDPVVPEQPYFEVIWPDKNEDDEDEPPDEVEIQNYTEFSRSVEVVRVENPDDPEQYVEVERIKSIIFAGPQGTYVRFILNN